MNSLRPGLAQIRLTVDVVIFTIDNNELKLLLIERVGEPFIGQAALPGGFLWEGESTEEAARRVLKDKAGVSGTYLEQLYTFDKPGRDPRGQIISVTYFTLVPSEALRLEPSGTTQRPHLQPLDGLPQLAFDHNEIVDYAMNRLRSKLEYTNVAYSLLPSVFTFAQLQQAYEIILGQMLDRRNFRKKFMSLGLIKPTGVHQEGGRHRPAELYTFVSRQPSELERWF